MTLAAMRHQVDVAALQSEKSKLTTHCEHERDAKQQLQIIVCNVYNILFIPPFVTETRRPWVHFL